MLTQSEADALFAMPKKPKSMNPLAFPHAGGKLLVIILTIANIVKLWEEDRIG